MLFDALTKVERDGGSAEADGRRRRPRNAAQCTHVSDKNGGLRRLDLVRILHVDMVSATPHPKSPWTDRFRQPSLDELRSHYDKQACSLVDRAREMLLDFEGVREGIEWHGVPWRWTLVYTCPDDPTRAWAYLVPSPEKPQIVVPLTTEMIESIPVHRLKKHVRDGIRGGRQVADICWASWDIGTRNELEDVVSLAKRKHKMISAHN